MTTRILQAVAVMSLLAIGLWAADDPMTVFQGTWKVNNAKSKFGPGPVAKSFTRKIEISDGGEKITDEIVTADGKTLRSGYSAKFDGKDYPWTGNPNAETISIKKVNDRTSDIVWKKNGKVTITVTRAFSADGKTLTATQKGTNVQGQQVNDVLVFVLSGDGKVVTFTEKGVSPQGQQVNNVIVSERQ